MTLYVVGCQKQKNSLSMSIINFKSKSIIVVDTKLSYFESTSLQKKATLNSVYVFEALQRKVDDHEYS